MRDEGATLDPYAVATPMGDTETEAYSKFWRSAKLLQGAVTKLLDQVQLHKTRHQGDLDKAAEPMDTDGQGHASLTEKAAHIGARVATMVLDGFISNV